MNKILVIFTGGTIGSAFTHGVIDVRKEGSALLDLYFKRSGGRDVAFDTLRILDMLSENASVAELLAVADALSKVDFRAYMGVIVAYGTDTLAYCANFAAMALSGYPIPAVFVSSDKPLDAPDANGVPNFAAAVDFILSERLPGFYAAFGNPGESVRIHLGSRLLQSGVCSDRFDSIKGYYFGEMRGAFIQAPFGPSKEELFSKKNPAFGAFSPSRVPYVLTIKPCPGTDFNAFALSPRKPNAILLELYHSGTACVSGAETDATAFLRRCSASGVPVILASYPYRDGRKYASTAALEEAGGIFACRMSAEAAYAKTLAYFLTPNGETLAEFLEKDVFFEHF